MFISVCGATIGCWGKDKHRRRNFVFLLVFMIRYVTWKRLRGRGALVVGFVGVIFGLSMTWFYYCQTIIVFLVGLCSIVKFDFVLFLLLLCYVELNYLKYYYFRFYEFLSMCHFNLCTSDFKMVSCLMWYGSFVLLLALANMLLCCTNDQLPDLLGDWPSDADKMRSLSCTGFVGRFVYEIIIYRNLVATVDYVQLVWMCFTFSSRSDRIWLLRTRSLWTQGSLDVDFSLAIEYLSFYKMSYRHTGWFSIPGASGTVN